jgi:hypothetical protein
MPANKVLAGKPALMRAGLVIGVLFAGTASALSQDVMQSAPNIQPVQPIPLPSLPPPATASQSSQTAQPPSTATATPQTSQH